MLTTLIMGLFVCPTSQIIKLDLEAWRARAAHIKQLDVAKRGAELKRYAAAIHVEVDALDEKVYSLSQVKVREVYITGADEPDKLVELIYTHQDNEEDSRDSMETVHQVSVLKPIKAGEYCDVGGTSLARNIYETPCDFNITEIGGRDSEPLVVKPVSLLSPERDKRQALEVTSLQGACFGGERGSDVSRYYLAFIEGAIKRVFSAPIYESSYSSPNPPLSIYQAEVKLTGDWPKRITLEVKDECMYAYLYTPEPEEGQDIFDVQVDCIDYIAHDTFKFNGSTYVREEHRVFVNNTEADRLAHIAYSQLRSREFKLSIKISERALEMTDQPALRGAILFNLGLAHEALGKTKIAISFYQRSLKVRPGNKIVMQRLKTLLKPIKR